jgi:hypothetical protein
VTKVELIKSAGLGFDEEALKAGGNVFAVFLGRLEFTYIYRFRLAK